MTRKTTECYVDVFQYIEKTLFKLSPTEFMTDFEGGQRKALKMVYPNAVLRGCWFHYCACIRKKAMKLKLKPLLDDNSGATEVYKKIMNLPLLPSRYIERGYLHIKQRAKTLNLHKEFKKFFEYFEEFWLAEVC